MSVALYIVPEREVAGLETFVNGKTLGHSEDLDRLAERAGVRPLMEFFSQDPAEAEALFEAEEIESPAEGFAPEQWFRAEDGLKTVRGLLAELATNATKIPEASSLIGDLKEFESVLSQLASEEIGWHLAVDY